MKRSDFIEITEDHFFMCRILIGVDWSEDAISCPIPCYRCPFSKVNATDGNPCNHRYKTDGKKSVVESANKFLEFK